MYARPKTPLPNDTRPAAWAPYLGACMLLLLIRHGFGSAAAAETVRATKEYVIFEAEAATPPAGWRMASDKGGYAGRGYLVFDGPRAADPGASMAFRVALAHGGDYQVGFRGFHADEEAYLFMRVDGGNWQRMRYASEGGWQTTSIFKRGGGNDYFNVNLPIGVHTVEVAGLDAGFHLDRVVIFKSAHKATVGDPATPATENLPVMPAFAALPKAGEAWEKGDWGETLEIAQKALADKDAATAAEAKAVVDAIVPYVDTKVAGLTELKAQAPVEALESLEALAKKLKGSDKGKELDALAKTWARSKEYKDILKAEKVLDKIQRDLELMEGNGDAKDPRFANRFAKQIKSVRKAAEYLRKKYPDTPARRRIDAIVTRYAIPMD